MEIEVFEIIKAVNKSTDVLKDLVIKIDRLSKTPALRIPPEFLEDAEAAKMLRITRRTLAKLRAKKAISCFYTGHKYLYLREDIQDYLLKNCRINPAVSRNLDTC